MMICYIILHDYDNVLIVNKELIMDQTGDYD